MLSILIFENGLEIFTVIGFTLKEEIKASSSGTSKCEHHMNTMGTPEFMMIKYSFARL